MARIFCVLVALVSFGSPLAAEQILYQSATLGQTGVSATELLSQQVPGTNVNSSVFVGARFELTQPVITSRIGGHFAALGSLGDFFGAIVALDGPIDLPDSADLSTPDVLGHTLLEFPAPSDDALADLELALAPGWYGVVFGSGLFGATGVGAAVNNGGDAQVTSYIGWQAGAGWGPRSTRTGQRLAVIGRVVPEPCSAVMIIVTASLCLVKARRNSVCVK